MSIWKEIKYALNSTLGTNDFEPLDEMIINQTRMVASEDEYAKLNDFVLYDVPKDTEKTEQLPQKIKMIRAGTMNLTGILTKMTSETSRYVMAEFRVYKNGLLTATVTMNYDSTQPTNFSRLLSFNPYDVFTFELYIKINAYPSSATATETSDFSVHDIKMCGKIQHNTFIEI